VTRGDPPGGSQAALAELAVALAAGPPEVVIVLPLVAFPVIRVRGAHVVHGATIGGTASDLA
jgi:hypothetical protein